jgi:uncharacterized protein (TIGR00369 family)
VEELVERVRAAVAQQPFMTTLGVTVAHAAAGEVDLELPFDAGLAQQHGFLHAGAVAAVFDSACGHAAWAAADGEADVLTVEYKVDLLEPAVGERVLCQGRVLRRGGRLTVCRGEAYAHERLVATSTTTMAVRRR